jgi:putative restriction endonuclease
LLALLDMAEAGELRDSEDGNEYRLRDRDGSGLGLRASPGLHVRFNAFTSLALPRWGGAIKLAYPFYHLRSQGFWTPLNEEGRPAGSPENTKSIFLNSEFLRLMQDPAFRREARIVLVETYFPPDEGIALYTLLGVQTESPEFERERVTVQEAAAVYAMKKGRSARFKVQVVCGYEHTCALTGYRLITSDGASMIEAAHIEPWAETQNDDPHNGLALSPNAHWSFDAGLWTVDNDLRVVVQRDRFDEWTPHETLQLKRYHGQPLHFAPTCRMRPKPDYFNCRRRAG